MRFVSLWTFSIILFLILNLSIFSYCLEVNNLYWVDVDEVKPLTGEELKEKFRTGLPFEKDVLYKTPDTTTQVESGNILIVVNSNLYPDISTNISNYVWKMESLGYDVTLWTSNYGTPEDLRGELQNFYAEYDHFTLFMIGYFPPAISEIGLSGSEPPYPIDLFFMDLDGIWNDTDDDGYYDEHTGNTSPEIAFGRLWASTLGYDNSDEADLINRYFEKDLNFWNGGLSDIENKALAFVDDDWTDWASQWAGEMGVAYNDMTLISEIDETVKDEYENILDEDNYESILLCAHSNPNYHQFRNGVEPGGLTYYYDIYEIEPNALFFNLFCCSNAQYTYDECMGCWYIMNPSTYTLASVGSTKTGSMLYFDYFYRPLSEGHTYGESFRQWFDYAQDEDSLGDPEVWFSGMTLLGDPLLLISQSPDINTTSFDIIEENEGVSISWEIETENTILGYNIYRREVSPSDTYGSSFYPYQQKKPQIYEWERLNGSLIIGNPPYTYIDEGAEMDKEYSYKIHAVIPRTEVLIGSDEINILPPESFSITSVSPNPASESINVFYSINEQSTITLKIYDIAGRLVWEITPEVLSPGEYSDKINVTSLSSGVYCAVLDSDKSVSVKKFVVTR